jgi:hypothetical protein
VLRKNAAPYRNVIEPKKPRAAFLNEGMGKLGVSASYPERLDVVTVFALETSRVT